MIACVLIPGFLAMTERHNKAAQHGQPIILYASNGQKRYVYSLCREAVSAGVIPGMPLRQAQTLCPDAQLIPANPPRYREALNALIDTLALFTNRLEAEGLPRFGKHWRRRSGLPMHSAAYHMVAYLDLGKLPSGEALDLGRQIQRAIETYQHMQASVGLASNKFTAYVAARLQKAGSVQLVRPGDEAGFLARRPVTLLPLESEIAASVCHSHDRRLCGSARRRAAGAVRQTRSPAASTGAWAGRPTGAALAGTPRD